MRASRGQTLLEFCLVLGAASAAVIGAGRLGWHAWERVRCRHLVFEAAHRGRLGLPPRPARTAISVHAANQGFTAGAVCGGLREEVTLPSLTFYLGEKGK